MLLRHRQTVECYPSIANVIAADINKLSQFVPNTKIKFKLASLEEAVRENIRVKQFIE